MYDTKEQTRQQTREQHEYQACVRVSLPPLIITPAPPLRLAGAEEDELPEPHIVRGID